MGADSINILAGDVGGTTTRLAAYSVEEDRLEKLCEEDFASRAAESLEELVARFLAARDVACERACFGIPGPVHGRVARTTNLPWLVEAAGIEARADIGEVFLLNDLEALAWGISELGDDDVLTLHHGEPDAVGNRAVIAAGTGLGQAGLFWDGSSHRPWATEGGHTDFAPITEDDDALLRFLRTELDHVSWERVVSGPGLHGIYRFLLDRNRVEAPEWLAEGVRVGDPAAAVALAAERGEDELADRAVRTFIRLYGAEAGNLALKVMARGGVYVAGGIAPKLRDLMSSGLFVDAFLAKGRMRPLLERMPVRLVLNPRLALPGAARRALAG